MLNYRPCLGKLDEDDVAEALLGIICDGHRTDATLVIKCDYFVIWCVSLRWNPGVKRFVCSGPARKRGLYDSLIMVRLRESEAGRKTC